MIVKKHGKELFLLRWTMLGLFLVLLATGFFIGFWCLTQKNSSVVDWGSFLGGMLAYCGTVVLGAVSVWQNVKQRIDNNQAQDRLENINKELLEQNKSDTVNSVRPYIALSHISQKRMMNLIRRDGESDSSKSENRRELDSTTSDRPFYMEYPALNYYFVITEDEIKGNVEEPERIRQYRGRAYPENSFGLVREILDVETLFLPFTIENVGKGCAVAFQVALYREGKIDSIKLSKHFPPTTFNVQDPGRIELLFDATVDRETYYYLVFRYMDIFGKKYEQKFPLSKRMMDFSYNQTSEDIT